MRLGGGGPGGRSEREEVLEKANRQGGLGGEDIEFRRADGSTFVGRVTDTVVRERVERWPTTAA